MSLTRTASRLAFALTLLLGLTAPMAQAAEAPPIPPGWHRLTPSEIGDKTPFSFEHQALIQAPPAAVFELLVRGDWRKWFEGFEKVEWTSPEPHGVGSTRTVYTKALSVQERILAWEPGKRFCFSLESDNAPLLERMLEDMQLEAVDGGKATRMSWRIDYAPSPLMGVAHPIAGAYFKQMFGDNLASFKRYAEKHQKFLVD